MAHDTGPARTRPLTNDEFAAWRVTSIATYAADVARSRGTSIEDEMPSAQQSFDDYLGDGVQTRGHQVLAVLDADGRRVGAMWLGPHPTRPAGTHYVYDIGIDEQERGKGHGRAAMLAAEVVAAESGAGALALNVFGFNATARGLYDALGYRVVSTQMIKGIEPR